MILKSDIGLWQSCKARLHCHRTHDPSSSHALIFVSSWTMKSIRLPDYVPIRSHSNLLPGWKHYNPIMICRNLGCATLSNGLATKNRPLDRNHTGFSWMGLSNMWCAIPKVKHQGFSTFFKSWNGLRLCTVVSLSPFWVMIDLVDENVYSSI